MSWARRAVIVSFFLGLLPVSAVRAQDTFPDQNKGDVFGVVGVSDEDAGFWFSSDGSAFAAARLTRNDAIKNGDVKTFDQYTTDHFRVTDPAGNVRDKAKQEEVVAANKTGQGPPKPLQREHFGVYNGNTIVANWVAGGPQGVKLIVTEVWVKDGATWKCATAHASIMPEKP